MGGRWRAMALILTARTAFGFQFQAIPAVAPDLARDLGVAFTEIGALFGLYMLPGILVAVPAGLLGRRFGDRRVALAGLALMMAGGAVTAGAGGFLQLAIGQLVAGTGAILMGVLTVKMTADWFAGRDLPFAMAVMLNGFPVGMAAAQLLDPALAGSWGWRAACVAGVSGAALAFVALALPYRPHANDRATPSADGAAGDRLSRQEFTAVNVAGAMWAAYNGAYIVLTGFSLSYLVSRGATPEAAGVAAAAITLSSVAGVMAGGFIARLMARHEAFIAITAVFWAVALSLAPILGPAPTLIVAALVGGLPAGVISSLPGQVLRARTRGAGLGVFFVWLYIGFAVTPAVAGWLTDLLARAEAPLHVASGLLIAMLPLVFIFAALRRRMPPPG